MRNTMIRRISDNTFDRLKDLAKDERISLNTLMLDTLDIREMLGSCNDAFKSDNTFSIKAVNSGGYIVWKVEKWKNSDGEKPIFLEEKVIT